MEIDIQTLEPEGPKPEEPAPRPPRDLALLTRTLKQAVAGRALRGYVNGKTILRDALVRRYRVSVFRAEILVDQLRARGFLRYLGKPDAARPGRDLWILTPKAVTYR